MSRDFRIKYIKHTIRSSNIKKQRDLLRCLPFILHSFHFDIIDLWIKLFKLYHKNTSNVIQQHSHIFKSLSFDSNYKYINYKINSVRFLKYYHSMGYLSNSQRHLLLILFNKYRDHNTDISFLYGTYNNFDIPHKSHILHTNDNLVPGNDSLSTHNNSSSPLSNLIFKKESIKLKLSLFLDPNKLAADNFLSVSSILIVNEITRRFSSFFSNISNTELAEFILSNDSYDQFFNISNIIHLFNKLSYWVPTTVLLAHKLSTKILIIDKFINIAMKLLKLNNFFGLLAIHAGLSCNAITRIKFLWSDKTLRKLNILNKFMSIDNNYLFYRNFITNFGDLPIIPLLSIVKSDTIHLLEVGLFDSHSVNSDVMHRISSIFKQFFSFNKYYSIPFNQYISSFIDNIHVISDDDHLYSLSIQLSPIVSPSNFGVKSFHSSTSPHLIHDLSLSLNEDHHPNNHHPNNHPDHPNNTDFTNTQLVVNDNLPIFKSNTFPSDVSLWDIDNVISWLYSINMQKYENLFTVNNINGYELLNITDSHLISQLGIDSIKDRIIIKNAIRILRNDFSKSKSVGIF
jgi:hypothetical protein